MMKAGNVADSPKTRIELINQLAIVLRSADVHDIENVAVIKSIKKLGFLIAVFIKYENKITIELRGDFFFINDLRIRYSPDVMVNFDYLIRLFRKLELGAVIFLKDIAVDDIIVLVNALVKSTSENSFDAISTDLDRTDYIKVKPLKKIVEEELVDARKMVKKTYFQAVSFTKGVMNKIRSGEIVTLKRAKRMVVSMVDHLLDEEQLLIGMTSIKDYDEYTYHHSVNVSILSVALGQRLGLNMRQLTELGTVALFHDIGKMEIPSSILNKSTELTEDEWKIIKKHPVEGVRALFKMRQVDYMSIRSSIVAFEHHMFFNNTGYPTVQDSFVQDLYTRIVSLADQYDAMTSARVYAREAMSPDKALSLMMQRAGRQLDPLLLKFFISMIGVYPIGTMVMLDSQELGIVSESNPGSIYKPKILIITEPNGKLIRAKAFDLTETNTDGSYKKSIVKTFDAKKYKINIAEYLL
jgi:putative nucleotidyltransferase with HDIG domain